MAEEPEAKTKPAKATKRAWPKSLSAQAGAVHAALVELDRAVAAKDVAKCFGTAAAKRVELIDDLLETLETLGKARQLKDGRFVAT